MREKINRLARGVLNEEQPVLSVSPERIETGVAAPDCPSLQPVRSAAAAMTASSSDKSL